MGGVLGWVLTRLRDVNQNPNQPQHSHLFRTELSGWVGTPLEKPETAILDLGIVFLMHNSFSKKYSAPASQNGNLLIPSLLNFILDEELLQNLCKLLLNCIIIIKNENISKLLKKSAVNTFRGG